MRTSHLTLGALAGMLLLVGYGPCRSTVPESPTPVSAAAVPLRARPTLAPLPPALRAALTQPTTKQASQAAAPRSECETPTSTLAPERMVGIVDESSGTIRVVPMPPDEPTAAIKPTVSAETMEWTEIVVRDDGSVDECRYTRGPSGERVLASVQRLTVDGQCPSLSGPDRPTDKSQRL